MAYAHALAVVLPLQPPAALPGAVYAHPIVRARVALYSPPGSAGVVAATVKIKAWPNNIPVSRRVRLYRDEDGLLIGETWSNPDTGYYRFSDVPMGVRYTVLAYDHTHDKRAVVADNLLPEAE